MEFPLPRRLAVVLLVVLPVILGGAAFWVRSRQPVILRIHDDAPLHMAFSRDGQKLVAAGFDGLYMWDLRSARLQWTRVISDLRSSTRSDLTATAIDFSSDGEKLLVRRDTELQYCDADTGKILAKQRHHHFVGDAGFKPQSQEILCGEINTQMGQAPFAIELAKWIPPRTEKPLKALHTPVAPSSLQLSHNTSLMAVLAQDTAVRLYDTHTEHLLWSAPLTAGGEYLPLATFSNDDKYMATCRRRGPIQIWNVGTGKLVSSYTTSYMSNIVFGFSSGGTLAAVWKDTDQVVVWDITSGKSLRVLDVRGSVVHSLQFSPDDSVLAIGTGAGVWLWRQ